MASAVSLSDRIWSYENQTILAPMVRMCTLPFRQLALEYGATMVYSEELIDHKLRTCVRSFREDLGQVQFCTPRGEKVFVTYPDEPVALQIGTSDAVRALEAAEVFAKDVRAIDINCGCPKPFSIQGGFFTSFGHDLVLLFALSMGAALLRNPEGLRDILSTLRRNLPIPVTCKVRLLESPEKSVALMQVAEKAGAEAIAVHARQIIDRPYVRSQASEISALVDCVQVPVIHNGDVFTFSDIERLKRETRASSIMIARGAQWNCSVFGGGKGEMLPVWDVAMRYLDIAERVQNAPNNSRYCVQEMLKPHSVGPEFMNSVSRAKTHEDLRSVLSNMQESVIGKPYSLVEPKWKSRDDIPIGPRIKKKLTKKQKKRAREWNKMNPEAHADYVQLYVDRGTKKFAEAHGNVVEEVKENGD